VAEHTKPSKLAPVWIERVETGSQVFRGFNQGKKVR
jgi:hypothetical protein